ncbi:MULTISPECIES: cyanophycin synthetase [Cysteiniphilum]|uniref:cyanophycin synthetase n=1 Tax=Cysteiniphilum TaxID=2056696 RepID=UPI0017816CCA|nr:MULTISPECIES: cyanophycin synthetase [Cysteiniphilum]
MQILSTNVYIGPNVYANFPVIRHVIDLGILEEWPSAKLGADFIDALIEALPGLKEHGCSYREPGGFIRRMREDEGTWMGHIWEHVAIELQDVAGSNVSFGKTRSTGEPRQYNMVFEYKQKDVGLQASFLARDLLISLLPQELQQALNVDLKDFDFEEERVRFIKFAQSKEFGPSTGSLVEAATKRDIPYIRLNDQSLVQFGHGKYQNRIQATITGETKHIAVEISCDKEQTNTILNGLGLPVPKQRSVRHESDALSVARHLGYPLVVKPLNGNHGRGISINIQDDEGLKQAYALAKEHGRWVVLEQYIEGFDHRMLVVNGKLVAVAKRVPGHVVGDGKHTIAELIDTVNKDPRRGVGHEKVLTRLELDHQALTLLEKAGLTAESILASGEICYLRKTANLSTGGTAIDLTDVVHPDNREMAERAVTAIGLDVGGVDFLSPDITQSYQEIGGGICEVNAAPGFRMHVSPSEGYPRDVAGAVMDMLFPDTERARIPIAAITGTNGKTTTTRMVAHMWKIAGKCVGFTTTDGVYVNGKLSVAGDMTGPKSAQMVLRDPNVDVAVFETARGGLLRSGLGYDYCNVGACINIAEDHMGLKGINTLEELAEVKRIVTDAARDVAVLNADDPHCLKLSAYTQAEHIMYVTMNPEHALVKEHIRAGGKAVVIEKGVNGDMITIFDNHIHMPVLWTHLIPATMEGRAVHNVQNAMFAVAIAYSMNMSLDDIKNGLRTFTTSFYQAPGRMNWFDEHPFKVLMDYGHNPAAVLAMGKLVEQIDTKGIKTCVIAAPGDRRDQDIANIAKAVAPYFDQFICKQDDGLRGRKSGEVPHKLKEALLEAGISENSIQIIESEQEAVDHTLQHANVGDLLVVFADNIKRTWKQIIHFNKEDEASENTATTKTNTTIELSKNHGLAQEIVQMMQGGIIADERGVRLVAIVEEDAD